MPNNDEQLNKLEQKLKNIEGNLEETNRKLNDKAEMKHPHKGGDYLKVNAKYLTGDIKGERVSAVNDSICLRLKDYYLWVDSTGDLRIKSSEPTSDTDGSIVGQQS